MRQEPLSELAPACSSDAFFAALRTANENLATLDRLTRERDDARAELDNMVNLTIEVGRLGNYLQHAIADRDDFRERADEWRDRHDYAQCRMDEMAAEIAELRGELASAHRSADALRATVNMARGRL
jgi:uncharacterized coiled-coil DUF342 family protein